MSYKSFKPGICNRKRHSTPNKDVSSSEKSVHILQSMLALFSAKSAFFFVVSVLRSYCKIRVKTFFAAIIFLLGFTAVFPLSADERQPSLSKSPELKIFYSPNCHRCAYVKNKLMPVVEKDYKGQIQIEYYDISGIENYKLLYGLKERYKPDFKIVPPVFFTGGYFLNGDEAGEKEIKGFIKKSLLLENNERHVLPAIDLVEVFKNFEASAVISAGLIDGVNPCAFTVIVFFISFLALQGYRKRDLIIIGLVFISSVFLTYLFIGIGLFGFLYRLSSFWVVSKIFNISIGVLSIVLGVFALADFFKFKRTKKTEGLILQLPKPVKDRIHSLIGLYYRRTDDEIRGKRSGVNIFKLILSAFITGFLVSILEAVCTGQVYLPTITFVLKTAQFKLQALWYLLVYNLMFIVPLLIVLLFALLGTTSEQFARIFKKHLLTIKIFMAVLFFGLGLFLIWRA